MDVEVFGVGDVAVGGVDALGAEDHGDEAEGYVEVEEEGVGDEGAGALGGVEGDVGHGYF